MDKTICITDDCEKTAVCRRLCGQHYNRGRPYTFRPVCIIKDCISISTCRKLCARHYNLDMRKKRPRKPLKIELHGMYKSSTYSSWQSMKRRCVQSNPYYRDVKICKRWQKSFICFYNDMGFRPEGTSIDRIDNKKGYKPSNCKWSTKSEQANNRRKMTDIHKANISKALTGKPRAW